MIDERKNVNFNHRAAEKQYSSSHADKIKIIMLSL